MHALSLSPSLPPMCLRASLIHFSQYCFSPIIYSLFIFFSANRLIERTCSPTGIWYHSLRKRLNYCFAKACVVGTAFLLWKDHSEERPRFPRFRRATMNGRRIAILIEGRRQLPSYLHFRSLLLVFICSLRSTKQETWMLLKDVLSIMRCGVQKWLFYLLIWSETLGPGAKPNWQQKYNNDRPCNDSGIGAGTLPFSLVTCTAWRDQMNMNMRTHSKREPWISLLLCPQHELMGTFPLLGHSLAR